MENSFDSANWSGSHTPFRVSWALQSDSSDSDWCQFHHGFSPSSSTGNFTADGDRAESLSKSHRLAEKRRRDRINSHLSALRKLVPNSDKMDKAALLATVIEQVKELKQKAAESSTLPNLPTEADELTVTSDNVSTSESDSQNDATKERLVFRASFCCEDHPEVLSEIIRVLKKLQLNTIRADIVCVGGRMRSEFVLANNGGGSGQTSAAVAAALKQSLSIVLSRITSSSTPTSCRIRSKRQRWFLSSHYSQ